MHPFFARILLALAASTATTGGAWAQGQPAPGSPAGTYQLLVCRNHCDPRRPERALAWGHLVLESAVYAVSDLPDPGRGYVLTHERLLAMAAARGRLNACFVLHSVPGARTLAGAAPVGFTRWSQGASPGTIRVSLAQLMDAGYSVEVSVDGEELRGRGASYGASAADTSTEAVWGRRVGPPDRTLCTRASDRAAAAWARFDSLAPRFAPRPGQTPPPGVAGTYEVEICPGGCERGQRRAAWGTLVLEESEYRVSSLSPGAQRYARGANRLLLVMAGSPNACFVLDADRDAPTYAGRQRVGFTRWTPVDSAGTLRANLFATVQGQYVLEVQARDGRLGGQGWSLVTNPFDDPMGPDAVVGRRVGPPDRSLCVRSAERAGAELFPPESR